jgi:hypothetical protein
MQTSTTTVRLFGAALLILSGCAYNPSPVLLEGSASAIAAMGGTWEGTYVGRQSQRSGTIYLTVRQGKDTAFGDVLMESRMDQPIVAWDVASGEHARHARAPQVLLIEFVAIQEDIVEGVMEPYVAPDCQCTVNTVFRGVRLGEEIEGEFVTRGPYGLYQTGTWKVRRVKTTIAE